MKKLFIILALLSTAACDQLRGKPGNPGAPGTPGMDGYSSLINLSKGEVDADTCESEQGTIVTSGLDLNRNGQLDNSEINRLQVVCDGVRGQDGQNGENGQDGQNGQDGADAPAMDYNVAAVHDPCGNGSGPDEVILEFANGQFVAWYLNLGLSILDTEVTYQTTDSQACHFKITSGGVFQEL